MNMNNQYLQQFIDSLNLSQLKGNQQHCYILTVILYVHSVFLLVIVDSY